MNTTVMLAACQERTGGAEAIVVGSHPRPEPAPGQVLVRVTLSAVNFADERRGTTGFNHFTGRIEPPPFVPGGEVIGTRCDNGQRVAALCRTGGHAQYVAVLPELLFPVPDGVDDRTALTAFVPGLTAALLMDAVKPAPTDRVAVLGATGAVGSFLLALLVERGVGTRIASVRDDRARIEAGELGATGFAHSGSRSLTEELQAAAGGPLDVVLDAVGGATTEAAVAALGQFGRLYCYGSASGESAALGARSLILGSRSVTGFWLMDHLAAPQRARRELRELLDLVAAGRLPARPPEVHALDDVLAAVRAAADRGRHGRILLDPWATTLATSQARLGKAREPGPEGLHRG